MKCMAMAGFLIPRPCRNEATGQCPICTMEICPEHTVPYPEGGVSCPSCAQANQPAGTESNTGSNYYNDYGYNTSSWGYGHHHYGSHSHYTHDDYGAFEREGQSGAEPLEQLDGS